MTVTQTAIIADPPAIDSIIPEYFDSKRRPSLFQSEPKVRQLGEVGVQGSFVNSQGLQIASYYWPVSFLMPDRLMPACVKAVICVSKKTGFWKMCYLLPLVAVCSIVLESSCRLPSRRKQSSYSSMVMGRTSCTNS